MSERREYVLTEAQVARLKNAGAPVMVIVVGTIPPMSPAENILEAWLEIGGELGFDGRTAEPTEKGEAVISALPSRG